MNTQRYAQRRETLRQGMKAQGIAALLVSLDANRYYLSGFELHDPQVNESAGRLVITASGEDWLCTDSRYYDAARRLWDEKHILIYSQAAKDINTLLREEVKGSIGFEADSLFVSFFTEVSTGLQFVPADGLVEKLRLIKDADEIELMQQACTLNHKLMQWVPSVLVPGRTEKQVAWDIEQFFRNHGATELSFASIVAVDENAALPHAVPGDKIITENCAVLIDVGCRLNDYCSDQTRSFWVGDKPADWFIKHLDLVQQAQQKALEGIRPGAVCSEIYALAKNFLDQHGVGHLFTHGLGHGIGLQTHEMPSLNPRNNTILQPGMMITVEPGTYQSGIGGIRWEYMALVTEDGYRTL